MEDEDTQHKNIKRLSNKERQRIIEQLLETAVNGNLKKGAIQMAATEHKVSRKSISKLWKIARVQLAQGTIIDVKSKSVGRVGRKRVEIDLSGMSQIPLRRRTNIRSMANALGLKKSTTHRLVQRGKIKSHTSAAKPYLSQENMRKRLEFCLSKIQPNNTNGESCYQDFFNYVHIDEKWFFMTKTSQKYYLHPTETEPVRTCKSKRFITKVMFMAAVDRPRFGANGEMLFDGKIGIFPFTVNEPVKRKSKNRAAGVMETKPILSVTKQVIKTCLVEQVLPAIKAKWPDSENKVTYIQQDNARPHIDANDPDFFMSAQSDGFDIRLTCQPANSPDLNVLDLGFFRAIQALQYESAPKTVVDLVQVVEKAYEDFEATTLNHVWVSLQLCMTEILKCKGSNEYKIPHVGKKRLERQGNLPVTVSPNADIVLAAIHFINEGQVHANAFIEAPELSQFIIEDDDHLQG